MKIQATKEIGRRLGNFKIPLPGNVCVEVGLNNLVGSDVSRGFPTMNNIHKCDGKTNTPISKPNWCDHCSRAVDKDECMKGYKVGKADYIFLTNDEVENAKKSFESTNMKVLGATTIENLKPYHILETYLLEPSAGDSKKKKTKDATQNERFYALLADQLASSKKYIVGKVFSARGETFVAITAEKDDLGTPMLIMYSMLYHDEMKNLNSAGYTAPPITDKEKQLMGKLVEKMEKDINFVEISSELRAVFDEKIANRNIGVVPDAKAQATAQPMPKDVDAVDMLEAALNGA